MSYTPTTWVTGDTVTATKLNKMEQGIVGAEGGGNPIITFNFSDFGSMSSIWNLAIGELDAGDYVAKRVFTGGEFTTLYDIYIYAPNGEYVVVSPYPVPKAEGWALLFLQPNPNYYETTVSGGISQTTVNLEYGSSGAAYIITGDCTINIVAT